MPIEHEASSALEAAQVISKQLPDGTTGSVRKLYTVLLSLSFDVMEANGFQKIPAFVTYSSSLEIVCATAGFNRITGWRAANQLKALGVLDFRPLKRTYRGKVRNGGTLFCVRLNPLVGSKARLSYLEMKQAWKVSWRSYRLLKHTKTLQDKSLKYLLLKGFTLNPFTDLTPVVDVCLPAKKTSLEAVLDVLGAAKEQRNHKVDLAAQALATALRDSSSLNWYRRLLWQLLRRYDAAGEDHSYAVYLAAKRAEVDSVEGFARRAGALFQSRLKAATWFAEVMNAPPNRVGTRPIGSA